MHSAVALAEIVPLRHTGHQMGFALGSVHRMTYTHYTKGSPLMSLRLRPSPEHIQQLLLCADIGPNQLTDVAVHLAKLECPPLRPDLLLLEIQKTLPKDESELLLQQLLSLSVLLRRSNASSLDLAKALRKAIENEEEVSKWDSVAAQFQSLLDSSPVRLVTKSMELSYDYANLLRGARILTDLRPLFNEIGTVVEGGVVTHTLRVSYSSADGEHELSLALDLKDIRKLCAQCDRAILKAETVRKEFVSSTSKPCIVSGEVEAEEKTDE